MELEEFIFPDGVKISNLSGIILYEEGFSRYVIVDTRIADDMWTVMVSEEEGGWEPGDPLDELYIHPYDTLSLDLIYAMEVVGHTETFYPATREHRHYVGSPTGQKVDAVKANGWGAMITKDNFTKPEEHAFYAFDNGMFADWRNGNEFNEALFFQRLEEMGAMKRKPDFYVVPDLIGEGAKSLMHSVSWLPRLKRYGFDRYLVVQDGMTPEMVEPFMLLFDGIFVGGTPTFEGFGASNKIVEEVVVVQTDLFGEIIEESRQRVVGYKPKSEAEWKLQTAEAWVELAHRYGKKCHIGRTSSERRAAWARAIGADSQDSSIVNFAPQQFKRRTATMRQGVMVFGEHLANAS